MGLIKRITDLLLALQLVAHQTHLTSTSHADHLLAERIEKDLQDNIDTLKEVALYCFDSEEIASCAETAKGVAEITKNISPDSSIEQCFSYILEIIQEIISTCYQAETVNKEINSYGLRTVLGDTARDMSRKGYLVKERLK